jgi:hypothetical protein
VRLRDAEMQSVAARRAAAGMRVESEELHEAQQGAQIAL